MAIHFVSGKPGGGKTLFAVRRMIRELVSTNKRVITNIELNLGRLNEYIQEKYPKASVDLLRRLRILTEEETHAFWENRLHETYPDTGVLFVLDEIHIFFNARNWMKTGEACLHYLSQHRKMGDTIICITQAVANVDKQFRSVAEDFSVLKNEYQSKFGIFKGRGRFTVRTYEFYPGDSGGGKAVPFQTIHFTLDVEGVASCYRTEAGVGVDSTAGDKLKPAKGIPIMWIFPAGLAAALVVGLIPIALGKFATPEVSEAISEEAGYSVGSASNDVAPQQPVFAPPVQEQHFTKVIYVDWLWQQGDEVRVKMTDGNYYTHQDPELEIVTDFWVQISGKKYQFEDAQPGFWDRYDPTKRQQQQFN